MKLKNIVIINDFDFVQGGASKVAIQTANMLAESNNHTNVYFFSAVHDESSTLSDKVIKISTSQTEALQNCNRLTGFINGIYNFKAKKELKKLLKTLDKKETIVHVHGWTKALSSSVFHIAFKMKFRVILTMHDYFTACPNGGYFNYKTNGICHLKPLSWSCIMCNCDSRNYLFKLYRILRQFIQNKIVRVNDNLTGAISISNFSEKILKETLGKNVKIYRVYNPIDLDLRLQKINFKKNKYFLYVGRVSKEKGVDIFCEAITKTNQEGIVVGDGSELTTLKEKYKNIKFVGWKKDSEIKKYMQSAKALIFPSLLYETMGLSVIEIAKFGIPAIANNACAAREFITDGKNGFLYKTRKELENAILNIDNLEYKISPKYLEKFKKEIYVKNILRAYNGQ